MAELRGPVARASSRVERLLSTLLAVALLPGVVVQELGHLGACRAVGVPVEDYALFEWPTSTAEHPAGGYVERTPASTAGQRAVVALGPLVLNSVVALLAFSVARSILAGDMVLFVSPAPGTVSEFVAA